MKEKWIKDLAEAVLEKLKRQFENVHKTLDSSYYFPALAAAAREQGVNITSDKARLAFVSHEVKRVAKDILRERATHRERCPTAGIKAPAKGWLEYALPPGDDQD